MLKPYGCHPHLPDETGDVPLSSQHSSLRGKPDNRLPEVVRAASSEQPAQNLGPGIGRRPSSPGPAGLPPSSPTLPSPPAGQRRVLPRGKLLGAPRSRGGGCPGLPLRLLRRLCVSPSYLFKLQIKRLGARPAGERQSGCRTGRPAGGREAAPRGR